MRQLLCGVLILSACSSGSSTDTSTGSELSVSSTTTTPTSGSTLGVTTSTAAPIEVTAEAVVLMLAAEGLPVEDYVAYTESSDPNELMGRPGGYTSKVNFHDARLEADPEFSLDSGGSVEVFEDLAGAAARFEYVDAITSGGGLFAEYHWLVGTVFLRASKSLSPDEASGYEEGLPRVLQRLMAGEVPPGLVPATTVPAGPVVPVLPLDSVFIDGNANPPLDDGVDGVIAVVAVGSYDGVLLPVVVRNRTGVGVVRIEVSASALDTDGQLLQTGSDQGFKPNAVGPGEIAFGYVYFDGVDLPISAEYEFLVSAEPADGSFAEFENIRDLTPVSHRIVDSRLVGELRNEHDSSVTGPIEVAVACFSDDDGSLLDHASDFADQDVVEAQGLLPFVVRLPDRCPIYLFAGSGFSN